MLRKVKSKKLYEQVVDQITNQILQGSYQKGSMLPSETELIHMTGVSRITVREALKALADVGVIETKKGKGSYVLVDSGELVGNGTDRTLREKYRNAFLESSKARTLIEPAAAAYMARTATDEQIAELERAAAAARSGDDGDSLDRFHTLIMQSLDNTLLLDFFGSLLKLEQGGPKIHLIAPEYQSNISADLVEQHEKILDAIRNRDAEFAYLYMKEHCLYLIKTYEEYFDQFYLPDVDSSRDEIK